jgi:3D (Asp-Asp-Asp) domain-containing protein
MKSRSAQRAQPLQENEGRHNSMKGFAYLTESSVVSKRFSGTRAGRKHMGWRVAAREATAFAIGTSLVLLSSLLAILLTQSVAGARDFSSQTANPRGSYSGVRMQQGHPQLDNDRKPDFGGSSVKIEPRRGSVDMQQGKIARDNDWIDAEKRGKNSNIFCGTNCRK